MPTLDYGCEFCGKDAEDIDPEQQVEESGFTFCSEACFEAWQDEGSNDVNA